MHSTATVSDLSDDGRPDTPARLSTIATARLLQSVAGCVPAMQSHARYLDLSASFPAEDIAALRACGVLRAPLPVRHGGRGLGTQPDGASGLFDLLRLLGRGNPSVGRIVEGHVNALQLICLYGTEAQIARAADDAGQGHLFAIWNTEIPPGVRLADDGESLNGRKDHGSAAGSATRPLITVDQSRLLLVSLPPGQRATASKAGLHGMRATQSGSIDFQDYAPRQADWIGASGDYLREPAFSAGAWRALAVIVGAVDALVGELRNQLHVRGRHDDPHQAARIAQALIAQETASLWTRKAAILAEAATTSPADAKNYVGLARRAVEMATLDAIQLTQRSLGLAALVDTNPVERSIRDLTTYLRQPALDEAIGEAAAHFVATPLP